MLFVEDHGINNIVDSASIWVIDKIIALLPSVFLVIIKIVECELTQTGTFSS